LPVYVLVCFADLLAPKMFWPGFSLNVSLVESYGGRRRGVSLYVSSSHVFTSGRWWSRSSGRILSLISMTKYNGDVRMLDASWKVGLVYSGAEAEPAVDVDSDLVLEEERTAGTAYHECERGYA